MACYLILIFQFLILIFYLVLLLIYIIKRKLELFQLEKIDKNDKEKFLYYRDALKNYTIGELGYLFNGKKNTILLIMAEIEFLKLKGYIKIDRDKIDIINNGNLCGSDRYILEHYKFINEQQFVQGYLKIIENSLKDKNCIKNYEFRLDARMMLSFILFIFSFFLGWFFALNNGNSTTFFIIEIIIFLIVCLVFLGSIFAFNKRFLIIKTSTGKDIYLKLNGLKNYLKDFGNFDDKNLEEIVLWEEYILYAIILNESKTLLGQAKEEFNKLIAIIYK